MRNVYLIGFMGAGKSTLGPALAETLSLNYVDLDDAVVAAAGKSIPDIFADDGEPRFRQWELDVLKTVAGPALVSLGGGAFMTQAVREHIRESGVSLYLDWPVEVLYDRVKGDKNRPLAANKDSFFTLFHSRLDTYRSADVVWRSEAPHTATPKEIVAFFHRSLTSGSNRL